MTVTLSQQNYWDLIYSEADLSQIESVDPSPALESDCTWKYSSPVGTGSYREIQIRDGVELAISDDCFHEDLKILTCDRDHPIELSYTLIGTETSSLETTRAGQYAFYGSGLAPGETLEITANQRSLQVVIHIEPAVFCQWLSSLSNQLPAEIGNWMKPLDQPYHTQICQTTAAMQTALQQILQCPFRGLTQQIYLEGKVWELVALHLAETLTQTLDADTTCEPKLLKPEDIERIHYAKDVLVTRLDQPPSLIELARLAGINDYKLKVGFRQVFGTTVFGYLHDCRMERSRQLLDAGDLSIAEAARAVGFVNRSHFAIAFRKKFGVNPRDFRQAALNQRNVG